MAEMKMNWRAEDGSEYPSFYDAVEAKGGAANITYIGDVPLFDGFEEPEPTSPLIPMRWRAEDGTEYATLKEAVADKTEGRGQVKPIPGAHVDFTEVMDFDADPVSETERRVELMWCINGEIDRPFLAQDVVPLILADIGEEPEGDQRNAKASEWVQNVTNAVYRLLNEDSG